MDAFSGMEEGLEETVRRMTDDGKQILSAR
jgi:hypothetical protein